MTRAYTKLVDTAMLEPERSKAVVGMTTKFSHQLAHSKHNRNKSLSKLFPTYGIADVCSSF